MDKRPMAKIDFIVIGDELLNGKISDRNVAQLAKITHKNQHTLNQVHIIGDNEKQFNLAMKQALSQADVVITSGGLGPTKDDQTKNMLAQYFAKPLQESKDALDLSKKIYQEKGREYDHDKFDYHILPKDFIAFNNPSGFAPGLSFELQGQLIFSTPGVPHEFSNMLETEIAPKINKKFKTSENLYHFTARTWKIPESKIFGEVAPGLWDELEKLGKVSSLPHIFGVDIGVSISSEKSSREEIQKKLENIIDSSPIKEFVWQYGTKSLAELIVAEASQKNLTIGFSESCTGGLCASMITDVSGSSKVFWGSVVSYANEVKIKSLGVSIDTLNSYGAVSEQTALEMAVGARNQLGVDIAVSTTGIAGPGGGSIDKPVGTVGIGFATGTSSSSKVYQFKGDREILKQRFANKALITLLEIVRKS